MEKAKDNKVRVKIMKDERYTNIIQKQRAFFKTGKTLDVDFRIENLKKLRDAVSLYKEKGEIALEKDLGKSKFETYFGEWGGVLMEIDFHIKNLRKWAKIKKVKTPLFLRPSYSRIMYEPYGVSLILAPWNYPFQLALMPVIGAISAGNTVILKPSELTPNTSALLKGILSSIFDEEYVTVIEGGVPETTSLLEERFDIIFFTGSTKVGKIIAGAAAKHLTPIVLELGGKSPVIFDENINMKVSIKRLAMAKVANSGQTCVSPDYIFIPENKKDEFVEIFASVIREFFPEGDLTKVSAYDGMTKIINETNFKRLENLLEGEKILWGGEKFSEELKIQPCLVDSYKVVDYLSDSREKTNILKEEIFGTILPIITYDDIDDVIEYVNSGEKPLALYIFSNDKNVRRKVLKNISFGGGSINDCMTHLANDHLPFGGVGESGQGAYHGYTSFLAFSHEKSLLYSTTKFDLAMRYMPHTEKKLNLLNKIFK